MAENHRFLNSVGRCKELMADGAIGDLRLIENHQVFRAIDISGWRASSSLRGGGILINAGYTPSTSWSTSRAGQEDAAS